MKVALVAGARPNFMKVAPVHAALARSAAFEPCLVHTGQHYDATLSALFFRDLGLPEPEVDFGVGSGTHARQTADVMVAFEAWVESARPGLVVVVGDVNSTLACALVAAKGGIPLAHVEAGLRSRDRTMPEEINRLVVDALSDLLFVSERSGRENLVAEGVDPSRIHEVGNVMIDSLLAHRDAARSSDVLERLGLHGERGHVAATLHRPSNVDDPARLAGWLEALGAIAQEVPVVLPLHPRTRARAAAFGLERMLEQDGLLVTPPLPYLDFLRVMSTARAVVTDSGGIQEETTVLGVPCLTVRENTERPITVEEGTNRLVGADPHALLRAWRELRDGPALIGRIPEGWDGHAAARIAHVLERWHESRA